MRLKEACPEGPFRGRAAELEAWLASGRASRPDWYHPVRVCGLFGAMRIFASIRGAVPLVHGPPGCAYFQKFQVVISFGHPVPAPCTGMGENDVIHGGEDRLRRAVLEVDRRYKPRLIAVLNTCTPMIIGDDVAAVLHDVRGEVGARYLLAVNADGLQHYSQGHGYNAALAGLIENVMQPAGIRLERSVNLFGEVVGGDAALARDKFLLRDMLARIGVYVNAMVPAGSAVEDIERAPRARLNVPRCGPMAGPAARLMRERFDVPFVSPAMPYGVANSERWLMSVAEFFGLEEGARRVIAAERRRLRPLLAQARAGLAGKRAAVHGGPGRVAANIRFAHELGCRIEVVSLFFATEAAYRQVLDAVAETGQDPLILIDRSMEEVRRTVAEQGIEAWFGNSLDFPATYMQSGLAAFETLIYQVPYEGFIGCANALRHVVHRSQHVPLARPAGARGTAGAPRAACRGGGERRWHG
jgi:nitrogenase molybdenum-cofactor synthesis protein NifE